MFERWLKIILMGFVFTSSFAQARVLWFKNQDSQNPLLYLNKDLFSEMSFQEVLIPAKEVRAGQLIAINDNELFEILGDKYKVKEVDFSSAAFNAVKAGTKERPFYQLIGGHNRFRRALQINPNLKVRLRILRDLSSFSRLEQGEILSMFGNFWSPNNPTGNYRRLLVSETTPSPWRSISKIKSIKNEFSHFWEKSLAFPEVEFGKRVYRTLIAAGFSNDELKTTSQVVHAIRSISNSNCSTLMRP